jgi:hypothetical protein
LTEAGALPALQPKHRLLHDQTAKPRTTLPRLSGYRDMYWWSVGGDKTFDHEIKVQEHLLYATGTDYEARDSRGLKSADREIVELCIEPGLAPDSVDE